MRKLVTLFIVSLFIISCAKERGNMIVKGEVKGLKKGTLYLQKLKDTILVSVDSITLFGDNKFILSDNVTSPEMYYLTYGSTSQDKKLMFFGEKGEITIVDEIEKFGFRPVITGSKNQEVLDRFKEVNQRFKMQRLDFIKKDFEARATKDSSVIKNLEKEYKKMVRKRFLFTTNFAIANKDTEAAPYIAISELFDANMYLLDTVNNSLTDRVKNSKYGKRLQDYINDVKSSTENKAK